MKPLPLFCALIACLGGAEVRAHNNLFLPGDAFFSAKFTRDFFAGDRGADGKLALEYHRYVGSFMACGFAGYENLRVEGLPEAMLANLRQVNALLFEKFAPAPPNDGEAKAAGGGGVPGFPIFVYNRSFPLSSPFGVKYNENWAEEQTGEAMMEHAIYDDLGGTDFIIDDWASAPEIAPLAIANDRAPMVTELGETGVVRDPLVADAKAVRFVVLAGADVASFARRDEGMIFFVVTEEIRRYRFNREGVAMPQRVDFPPDDIAEKRRRIRSDQQLLRAAINLYSLNHSTAPTPQQGLAALWEQPKLECPPDWMATLRNRIADPWGREYQWDGDVIFSLGADGVEGKDDVVEPFELSGGAEAAPAPRGGG